MLGLTYVTWQSSLQEQSLCDMWLLVHTNIRTLCVCVYMCVWERVEARGQTVPNTTEMQPHPMYIAFTWQPGPGEPHGTHTVTQVWRAYKIKDTDVLGVCSTSSTLDSFSCLFFLILIMCLFLLLYIFLYINQVHGFIFIYLFFTEQWACGILAPLPGIELAPLSVKAWGPNHWIAKEFSVQLFFFN